MARVKREREMRYCVFMNRLIPIIVFISGLLLILIGMDVVITSRSSPLDPHEATLSSLGILLIVGGMVVAIGGGARLMQKR